MTYSPDYRARYYDPTIGRFISDDPIRFDGGINFYGYVHNNPNDFRDPSGLLDVLIWTGGSSAGAGKPPYGHAAILLDDGTYISWWPEAADDSAHPTTIMRDGLQHWARDARDPSYAADAQKGQEGEGRGPDVDIYINSLDEAAIKKWWNEFQKNKTWDSYNRNCSNVAMNALLEGGAGKLLKPRKNWYYPTSPGDVKKYAQSLQIFNHTSWDHGIKLTF